MIAAPKKLLFITSNRLGDAVLSTGVLAKAIERFAPTEITIACGPIPAPLFTAVPNLKNIIILNKQERGLHWLKLWQQVVPHIWDVVIDLRNSAVSYLIFSKKTFRFTQGDETRHKSEQLADALKLTDIPYNKIWLSAAAQQLAQTTLYDGEPILALCPTANWQPKTWPANRFIKAALRLPFQRIAVFGAEHERAQAMPIINALRASRDVIDLVGKTNPLEAAACLARCNLCIANDSGLMHIAAAMGIPTLGLFGPSNDVEYAPHGPHTALVRGAPFDYTDNPFALMQAITVDAVVNAAKKLI
ncbi:MAG: glycosyltransferase family 9 protein [Alphaproteobacteria bacterium]|nr:glycosyltransferase family 9 protein [Alphaproteobacteria bacterium]